MMVDRWVKTSDSFPTAEFRFTFLWNVAPRPWIWRRHVGLILNGLNILEEIDILKLEDDIQQSQNVGHQQPSEAAARQKGPKPQTKLQRKRN